MDDEAFAAALEEVGPIDDADGFHEGYTCSWSRAEKPTKEPGDNERVVLTLLSHFCRPYVDA